MQKDHKNEYPFYQLDYQVYNIQYTLFNLDMYPYIVCRCGRSLGDLYDLYQAMKRAKYADEFGDVVIDPTLIMLTEELQIDINDIFEALHLDNDCCRSCMLSQVEIDEYY
jgi:DNA-directed RNA polymerase subunit N (RpoN/RPB10)